MDNRELLKEIIKPIATAEMFYIQKGGKSVGYIYNGIHLYYLSNSKPLKDYNESDFADGDIDEIIDYFKKAEAHNKPSTDGTSSERMVLHPSHYEGAIECMDAMLQCFGKEKVKAFCQLSAFKYMWRCQHKWNFEEDIKKATNYLHIFLNLLGDKNWKDGIK